MTTWLRLRYGLRWQGRRPPLGRAAFGLLVLCLLCLLAGCLHHFYTLAARAEIYEPIRLSYMKALTDCVNGDLRMQWGSEIFSGKCEPLGKAGM